MPEGPLGFPRLTSLGPLVESTSEKDIEELKREITRRPHSYRHYEPEEFIALAEQGERGFARQELDVIESGRFSDMLSEAHSFWWPLDQDEKEEFYSKNPGLVRWIEAWAAAEVQSRPSDSVDL